MTRPQQFRLALIAVLALLATTSAGPASAHVAGKVRTVKAVQNLAALLTTHVAYAQPTTSSKHVALVPPSRPITAERTTLPIIGSSGTWLHVELPGRPNGHTGWIKADGTKTQTTNWHIVVTTGSPHVYVYRDGHVVRVFPAIVGKPTTPTPHGQFFVEESIALSPSDAGAPYALALSARSNVFQEFAGGPGQIALHGLDNVGGVLGTAESHGCVRLADSAIRWLAWRVGPGVPVTITR